MKPRLPSLDLSTGYPENSLADKTVNQHGEFDYDMMTKIPHNNFDLIALASITI